MAYNKMILNSDKSLTYPCSLLKDIERLRIIFNVKDLGERAEQLKKWSRSKLVDAEKLAQLEAIVDSSELISERNKRVLLQYYLAGFTQVAIAEMEGVSVSRIGQLLHETLFALYKALYR